MDDNFKERPEEFEYRYNLDITFVPLVRSKNIYLLRVFEDDLKLKKKYIKTACFLTGNILITTNFSDTVHLIEEINLFENGNVHNQYFDVVEHLKTKNLKLKNDELSIFISKSESRAIVKLFNLSLQGYSMTRVLENEILLNPSKIVELLDELQLSKQYPIKI